MNETAITNPWSQLPRKAPYQVPSDAEFIQKINGQYKNTDPLKIHFELLPEPYLGRHDAPVVLLGLNPGFDEMDEQAHVNPSFRRKSRANLMQTAKDYPFFLLDPSLHFAPGHHWWRRKLEPLMAALNDPSGVITANHVLCVELFPYHSKRCPSLRRIADLPSQQYSFDVVRQAIERDALVLIMRGTRQWVDAIPKLRDYGYKEAATSPQNPVINEKQFKKLFKKVITRLRDCQEKAKH